MDYETSHPWLTFDPRSLFPREGAQSSFYFSLGEITSKVAHLENSALMPETMRNLNLVYLTKGVVATTAIEGNTLGEDIVRKLVNNEPVKVPLSQEYQEKEVRNILDICNEYIKTIRDSSVALPPVSLELINSFNRRVREGLPYDVEEVGTPGEIRSHSVTVGRYRGAPPQDCEYLLQRLVEWLNSDTFNINTSPWPVGSALLQAIAAHVYLVWIHPYGDGNGRTARLLELYLLLRAGLPTPACHLLSDHYNRTRDRYYQLLDKSTSRAPYNISEFVAYALQGFQDGLREQIEIIQGQQASILWKHLIYKEFAHRTSSSDIRRRRLAFYVSDAGMPVTLRVLENLPPAVFNAYNGLTTRALKRDLHALEKLGLIRETSQGYVPCSERIKAMQPARAATPTE